MDELSPITSSCSSSDSSVQSASFDGQIVLLRAASILAQVTPPPLIAPIFAVVPFAPATCACTPAPLACARQT